MPTSDRPARLIVLTGATRGLGRALAEKFIALGHTVIGCGRSTAEIKALSQRFPEPNEFYAVDVASDDAVKSWASLISVRHGAPDLLVNNAAIINPTAALWDVPVRDFDRVIDVNIKGVANVIRHFAPGMIARNRGVIVNFSSGWGRSAEAEVAPYCATKWAIEGMTQALALEIPSTLAAVALNPGIINTEMLRSCWQSGARNYPTPEQWVEAAAPFLLQLGARDNGKSLTVPGQ